MAFSIGGSFNKSLFNKGSYAAAIGQGDKNGYAVVKITPKYARTMSNKKDYPIKGVYNTAEGDLSFNIASSWEPFGGVVQSVLPGAGGGLIDAYQRIGGAANLLGAAPQANVFASKKIYQKSGYMEIKIPMMVVDWEGTGQPLLSALFLAYYCLPSGNVGNELIKAGQSFLDSQVEKAEDAETIGEKLTGAAANVADGTLAMGEGLVRKSVEMLKGFSSSIGSDKVIDSAQVEYAKENLVEGIDDIFTLRASPVPVIVEIGNFFKHNDMVIENLDYKFSKEMTKAGPLFVNFTLSLSTRKILSNVEDIGLTIPSNSRYMEVGGNLTGL